MNLLQQTLTTSIGRPTPFAGNIPNHIILQRPSIRLPCLLLLTLPQNRLAASSPGYKIQPGNLLHQFTYLFRLIIGPLLLINRSFFLSPQLTSSAYPQFLKLIKSTHPVPMEIKFIPATPSKQSTCPATHHFKSSSIRNTSSIRISIRRRSASVDSSDPSDSPSPKSSRFSCAGTSPTDISKRQSPGSEHPLRYELPVSSLSDGDKPKKISRAWRKTLYEYFKSDDEDILTSDDEWWLGSSKPYTEKQEPPSGKTRLPKQNTREEVTEDDLNDFSSTLPTIGLKCSPAIASASPEPEGSSDSECRTVASDEQPSHPPSQNPPPDSPIRTHRTSANFTSLDFPALSAKPTPVSVTDCLSCQVPDGPWKNLKQKPAATEFPPLRSPTRPQPSSPATRFICSFSSNTSQRVNHPDSFTIVTKEKEAKRSEAERREETLKATLPTFKLDDPAFSPQKITQCPSDQHPISELPQLIKSLCNDGILLPSGRPELEGGPYVAVAFDMEWTISRIRGHENRTAVIQIGSRSQVLIVQISSDIAWRTQGVMPTCLVDFLLNPQIVKIGVGIRNDGLKLIRDHKLGPKPFLNSFLELTRLVRALCQPDCASGYSRLISLQQIVADHLKVYLPKVDTRTSDWAKPLSETQINYAASDVMATTRVTMKLFKLFQDRTRKADSGLMILQYIESLEPTYDRSALPAQPPLPLKSQEPMKPSSTEAQLHPKPKRLIFPQTVNSEIIAKSQRSALPKPQPPGPKPTKRKQWRTLIPALGPQSVEVKKQWVVRAPTFLAPDLTHLKNKVSPVVQKSWQLWYHEGYSFRDCSKFLEINSVSIATNLGKMLIHLKLNKLSLDGYYQNWIKARLTSPEDFKELGLSIKLLGDHANEKTETDCAVDESLSNRVDQVALIDNQISGDADKVQETLERNEGLDNKSLEDSPLTDKIAQELSVIQSGPSLSHRSMDGAPVIGPPPLSPTKTAHNATVMEKSSSKDLSNETTQNAHATNTMEPAQQVTSWFDETEMMLKAGGPSLPGCDLPSQESGELIADTESGEPIADTESGEPIADTESGEPIPGTGSGEPIPGTGSGEPITDTNEKGKAAGDTAECGTTKVTQVKTMNFKIDDSEFLSEKTPADCPLFDNDELERIKKFNKMKTVLIDSFITGFGVDKRLRTSRNYFQLP